METSNRFLAQSVPGLVVLFASKVCEPSASGLPLPAVSEALFRILIGSRDGEAIPVAASLADLDLLVAE